MNATITTAARRIARDVNATSHTVSTYYDAEGQVIATLSAGAWLATGHPAGAAARIDGRRGRWAHITEAEVQAHLDAAAKVGVVDGPDFDVELALRLS